MAPSPSPAAWWRPTSTRPSTSRTCRRRSRWTTRSPRTSWSMAWPARLQVRRLQHPRQHHRGAAFGRAVRGRAGRQLRGRQQDGLLDQRLFLNLSAFHNKYKDIQLSVFTEYTTPQNTKAFFGDFTNAGEGTVNGVRSRIPVAADRQLADLRQPGLAGREVRRVHVQERQHRRPAGIHQRPGFLRRAERGIPHRPGRRRQPVGARGLQLPERSGGHHRSGQGPGDPGHRAADHPGRLWPGQRRRDLEGQRCVDRSRCRAAT
jgi:hypothetical protein